MPGELHDHQRLAHVAAYDGLRGVAVAAVLVYHLAPSVLPGGFVGVDVFFVLSGFLISSLILREFDATGGFSAGRFVVRRVRRLTPAMLLVLVALAATANWWATPLEAQRLRDHGWWTIAYLANWRFIADGTTYTDVVAGASPLRHVWSLAIEEQFYLGIAVIVGLGAAAFRVLHARRVRARSTRKLLTPVVLAVAAVSAAHMAVGSFADWSAARLYFGTDTRAFALLLGVALGTWRGRERFVSERSRLMAMIGGVGVAGLVVAMAIASETEAWMFRGGFVGVALVSAAAVLAAPVVAPLAAVLSWRPLVALGMISYGVYLWHWPVVVILDEPRTGWSGPALAGLRIAVTFAASIVSYIVVERPVRRGALGTRFGRGALAIAPVATAAVVFALAIVPRIVDEPVSDVVAPDSSAPITAPAPNTQPGAEPIEPLRVVVLGDSVAHTLAGGQVGAFPDFTPWSPEQSPFDPTDVELTSLARPGCSFLPGEVAVVAENGSVSSVSLEQFCGDWRGDLDAALTAGADDLVVLLSNDIEDRVIDGELIRFDSDAYPPLLDALLDELRGDAATAGTRLALVAAAPRAEGLETATNIGGWRERRMATLLDDYVERHPDVLLVDLGPVICPDGECDPSWRYDGLHLTRDGAVRVAALLSSSLRR
jgi:peptidoglycan/LPS O-acetylase OafA/YrhL